MSVKNNMRVKEAMQREDINIPDAYIQEYIRKNACSSSKIYKKECMQLIKKKKK